MKHLVCILLAGVSALGLSCGDGVATDASEPSGDSTLTRNVIQALHSGDCPNTQRAIAFVKEFAKSHQVDVSIERVSIETEDDAQTHRFLGSPTLRINGLDVDPAARPLTDYGFT